MGGRGDEDGLDVVRPRGPATGEEGVGPGGGDERPPGPGRESGGERGLPARARDQPGDVVEHCGRDRLRTHRRLGRKKGPRVGPWPQAGESPAWILPPPECLFVRGVGIAELKTQEKPVELRFRQRVSARLFARVLGGDDHEGTGKRVGHAVDGGLPLFHGLEERALGAGGGTVDLVGQKERGEEGPGHEAEAPVGRAVDLRTDDVGGQEVAGELQAAEPETQEMCEGGGEESLPCSGVVLQEEMTLGQDPGQSQGQGRTLAEENPVGLVEKSGEGAHEIGRGAARGGGRIGAHPEVLDGDGPIIDRARAPRPSCVRSRSATMTGRAAAAAANLWVTIFVTADTTSLLDGLNDLWAGVPLARVAELRRSGTGGRPSFCLALHYPPGGDGWEVWLSTLASTLARRLAVSAVDLEAVFEPRPTLVPADRAGLGDVAHLVAISSAKGGVGKSTVTYNLALALAGLGARVGVLDADIYGPSLARLAGLAEARAHSRDGRRLEPLEAHGLRVMSVAFLIPDDTAVAWRGPMVTQALQQILLQTDWPPLDYLLVDLPPGTGDIHLTLAQRIAVSGVVVVTTPQELAVLDARRGLRLFEKMRVPVLGVLENMRGYRCPHCGHEEELFGQGGGEALARSSGVPYLGALPLDPALRVASDEGRPVVLEDPEGSLAARFRSLALRLAAHLAALDPDSLAPPVIETEEH